MESKIECHISIIVYFSITKKRPSINLEQGHRLQNINGKKYRRHLGH